jgi:hypothetical protein
MIFIVSSVILLSFVLLEYWNFWWDIFLRYCAWKSFSVCVLGWSWYIYALGTAALLIGSILALFCVWTKSLMCNDAVNRDSTFTVKLEDSACESEEFKVPCQPSGRCVIPSRRPSVYCSIHLDDVLLPSGHLHRIEKLLCQLSPFGRFSSTSGCLSVLERFIDSFQVPRKRRSINCPDDVVSRPDAYLHKARIAVQNGPSGHLTVVVRTLVHRIW